MKPTNPTTPETSMNTTDTFIAATRIMVVDICLEETLLRASRSGDDRKTARKACIALQRLFRCREMLWDMVAKEDVRDEETQRGAE